MRSNQKATNSRGQTATEGTWAERTSQIRLAGPLRKEVLSLLATGLLMSGEGLRVGDGLNLPAAARVEPPVTIQQLGKSTEMGLLP